MNLMQLTILLALCGFASAASAAPCVSASFDRPLPGATNVVSHVADVPSAQFPAFWQEGRVAGYAYKVFSNAEGFLRSEHPDEDWVIAIACDGIAQTCDLENDGTAPAAAIRVAHVVGQCLIDEDVTADMFRQALGPATVDEVPAIVEPTETQAPAAPVVPAEPEPCGLAIVNEATEVARLQRLLVLAGEDPGPVDGFLGPQTFKAMDELVDDADWDTPIIEVITLLDSLLCEGQT